MISINDVKIAPTMFPDGTSQVWKLPTDLLDAIYKQYTVKVVWEFEFEAEFIHLAQLKTLLDTYCPVVYLDMPYLPYGRQDKRVSNGSTFALATFARLLNALKFTQVTVLDAHNNPRANAIENLVDESPRTLIAEAKFVCRANVLIFPDAGAAERYSAYTIGVAIAANKIRNPSSGEITGMELIGGNLKDKSALIVDDICDGGRTFIEVAKLAYNRGAKEVHLYTTHGLYTKGTQVLFEAGIKRIFNRKGEVK